MNQGGEQGPIRSQYDRVMAKGLGILLLSIKDLPAARALPNLCL